MDTPSPERALPTDLDAWLNSLRDLSATVAAGGSLEHLLNKVAAYACVLLGFELSGVFVPNAQRTHLTLAGASGLSANFVRTVNESIRVPLSGPAPASRAFATGQPVAVGDISVDRSFAPWGAQALQEGFRSLAVVPLLAEGEVLGTLSGYHRSVHGFAVAELEQMAHLADHAAIGIAAARIIGDLRAANAELVRRQDLLARSEDLHQRFLTVALNLGGMDGIAGTLATLLQRPVLIEDTRGTELATRRVDRTFAPAALRASLISGRESRVPIRLVADERRLWCSPVRLAGDEVARLWVSEGTTALDELDVRAIEHATLATALEMMRQQTDAETEYRRRSELVVDLLHTGVDDRLVERSRHLGHDLSLPHVALVVEPVATGPEAVAQLQRGQATASAVAASLPTPRPLVAGHAETLIVLWPMMPIEDDSGAEEPEARIASLEAEVRRTAGAITSIVTAGRMYRSPAQALRVALGALKMVRRGGRHGGMIRIPELGLGGMLLQMEDTASLLAYVEEKLEPLTQYDREHGTDLVDTLAAHIRCNLEVRATGARLRIHPNTVRQRLRRIEELTGADLRHPDSVLELNTVLTIREVVAAS